jgi:GTPase SAR1 family protein
MKNPTAKKTVRLTAVILIAAFMASDPILAEVVKTTLSPPLRTKAPLELPLKEHGSAELENDIETNVAREKESPPLIRSVGKDFRSKWTFVAISYRIAQALEFQISEHTLKDLLKQYLKTRKGTNQSLAEKYDIDSIKATKKGKKITEFMINVQGPGGEKVCFTYYTQKDPDRHTHIPVTKDGKVYVRSEILQKQIKTRVEPDIKTSLHSAHPIQQNTSRSYKKLERSIAEQVDQVMNRHHDNIPAQLASLRQWSLETWPEDIEKVEKDPLGFVFILTKRHNGARLLQKRPAYYSDTEEPSPDQHTFMSPRYTSSPGFSTRDIFVTRLERLIKYIRIKARKAESMIFLSKIGHDDRVQKYIIDLLFTYTDFPKKKILRKATFTKEELADILINSSITNIKKLAARHKLHFKNWQVKAISKRLEEFKIAANAVNPIRFIETEKFGFPVKVARTIIRALTISALKRILWFFSNKYHDRSVDPVDKFLGKLGIKPYAWSQAKVSLTVAAKISEMRRLAIEDGKARILYVTGDSKVGKTTFTNAMIEGIQKQQANDIAIIHLDDLYEKNEDAFGTSEDLLDFTIRKTVKNGARVIIIDGVNSNDLSIGGLEYFIMYVVADPGTRLENILRNNFPISALRNTAMPPAPERTISLDLSMEMRPRREDVVTIFSLPDSKINEITKYVEQKKGAVPAKYALTLLEKMVKDMSADLKCSGNNRPVIMFVDGDSSVGKTCFAKRLAGNSGKTIYIEDLLEKIAAKEKKQNKLLSRKRVIRLLANEVYSEIKKNIKNKNIPVIVIEGFESLEIAEILYKSYSTPCDIRVHMEADFFTRKRIRAFKKLLSQGPEAFEEVLYLGETVDDYSFLQKNIQSPYAFVPEYDLIIDNSDFNRSHGSLSVPSGLFGGVNDNEKNKMRLVLEEFYDLFTKSVQLGPEIPSLMEKTESERHPVGSKTNTPGTSEKAEGIEKNPGQMAIQIQEFDTKSAKIQDKKMRPEKESSKNEPDEKEKNKTHISHSIKEAVAPEPAMRPVLEFEQRKFVLVDENTNKEASKKGIKKAIEITKSGSMGKIFWIKPRPWWADVQGDREAEILRSLKEHSSEEWTKHFARGMTLNKGEKETFNAIEHVDGPTLIQFINSTAQLDAEEYFATHFHSLSSRLLDLARALKEFKLKTGKIHGDINHRHIILSSDSGRFVLIDFNTDDYDDVSSMSTMLKYIALRNEYLSIRPEEMNRFGFMPEKLVKMLKKSNSHTKDRYRDLDIFIQDLEILLEHMSRERQTVRSMETTSTEMEIIHSHSFADTIKYINGKLGNGENRDLTVQKPKIFLGTSWMKGYDEKTLQQKAINPLISAIRSHCESRGIEFREMPDGDIAEAVASQRKDHPSAKIVILADRETVSIMKEDKNTFLAGVDKKNIITDGSYLRLMEMLTITLRLASNNFYENVTMPVNMESSSMIITWTGKYLLFVPDASPMDYEKFKVIYAAQISA